MSKRLLTLQRIGTKILEHISNSDGSFKDISAKSGVCLTTIYRYWHRFKYIRLQMKLAELKHIHSQIKELKETIKKEKREDLYQFTVK